MAYMSENEEKEPIEHYYNGFTFKSSKDLRDGIKVTTPDGYNRNTLALAVATFIGWWTLEYYERLQSFNGFDTISFNIV